MKSFPKVGDRSRVKVVIIISTWTYACYATLCFLSVDLHRGVTFRRQHSNYNTVSLALTARSRLGRSDTPLSSRCQPSITRAEEKGLSDAE